MSYLSSKPGTGSGGGSPAGSSSWLQYNAGGGNFGADALAKRDPITKVTSILRTFTDGGTITTGFQSDGTISPYNIQGSALMQTDGTDTIYNGVFDLNVFGASKLSAGTVGFAASGDSANIITSATNISGAVQNPDNDSADFILDANEKTAQLSITLGGGDLTGFQTDGATAQWMAEGNVYKLPTTLPTTGDVMFVSDVTGNNVQLDFIEGGSGGVEWGGPSTGFMNGMIQYIDGSGLQGGSNYFTYDQNNNIFKAINNYLSNVTVPVFTGGGLNDMSSLGAPYTGNENATYRTEIDGFQDVITFSNLVGGSFGVGDTVTGSISGAIGQIEAGVEIVKATVIIQNGIHFAAGDVIDNGFGITADFDSQLSSTDTFKWYKDGVVQTTFNVITGSQQALDDGITAGFAATTGHTIGDYWTWYGEQFQNSQLISNKNIDFSYLAVGMDGRFTGNYQENIALGVTSYNGLYQTDETRGIALPIMFANRTTTNDSMKAGFQIDNTNTQYSHVTQISDGIDRGTIILGKFLYSVGFSTNGMGLDINDVGQTVFLGASGSTSLYIDDSVGEASLQGTFARMGDFLGLGNSSTFSIDDGAQTIIGATDGAFRITDVAGNTFFNLDIAGGAFGMGDIDSAGNGTSIQVIDAGSYIELTGGVVISRRTFVQYGTTTSVESSKYHYVVKDSTGATTFNLDGTYQNGQIFVFSDADFIALLNNITIDAGTGNTIISKNGISQTFVIAANGDSVTMQQLAAGLWMVI